jgi:membrane glycosyltransferase
MKHKAMEAAHKEKEKEKELEQAREQQKEKQQEKQKQKETAGLRDQLVPQPVVLQLLRKQRPCCCPERYFLSKG